MRTLYFSLWQLRTGIGIGDHWARIVSVRAWSSLAGFWNVLFVYNSIAWYGWEFPTIFLVSMTLLPPPHLRPLLFSILVLYTGGHVFIPCVWGGRIWKNFWSRWRPGKGSRVIARRTPSSWRSQSRRRRYNLKPWARDTMWTIGRANLFR